MEESPRRRTRPGAIEPEQRARHYRRLLDQDRQNYRGTVLLVDDDDLVRSAIRMNLQKNYVVFEAPNGYKGLEILKNNLEKVDCVITDIRMPGLNGSEYMAKAAEITRDVYFIVLTGHKGEVTESQLIGDGGGRLSGFLEKPVSNTELEYQIQKAIQLTKTQRDRIRAHDNAHRLVETIENIYNIKNLARLLSAIFENAMMFTSVGIGFLAFFEEGDGSLRILGGTGRFAQMIDEPVINNANLRIEEVKLLIQAIETDKIQETDQIMALPLKRGGMMLCGQPIVDPRDKNFIRTFARNAEEAIENVFYFKQLEERKRIEQELKIAAEIQTSMLPPELPSLEDLEIIGLQVPAKEVGGDYYDFIQFNDNLLGVCVGDVTGKGVPAGLVVVMVQSYLRILLNQNAIKAQSQYDTSLKHIIETINLALYKNVGPDRCMTFLLALWDSDRKIMRYAGAGHEWLIICRAQTGKCELIHAGGAMLGMIDDIYETIREHELFLETGDTIILYTDGVTETFKTDDEMYGIERFVEAIERNISHPVSKIPRLLYDDIKTFANGEAQRDDITIVVIRRK